MAAIMWDKKVKASSLLEIIIAMILIMLVFGIAMMIITNVTRLSLSGKKLRAEALVKKNMLLAQQSQQIDDQTLQEDDIRIEIKAKGSQAYPDLTEMVVTAYDANQEKVAELHQLIPVKHE
jgi:type II secretory pathway pseudopilin PulG